MPAAPLKAIPSLPSRTGSRILLSERENPGRRFRERITAPKPDGLTYSGVQAEKHGNPFTGQAHPVKPGDPLEIAGNPSAGKSFGRAPLSPFRLRNQIRGEERRILWTVKKTAERKLRGSLEKA